MGFFDGLGSSLLSGFFGYKGGQQQNVASAQQAQQQMAFQERMSNTAHQRQVADLRKAGLNPILSSKYGGASSPSGQQAPVVNKAQLALNSAINAQQLRKLTYENDILQPSVPLAKVKTDMTESLLNDWKKWWDVNNRFPSFNSAKTATSQFLDNAKKFRRNQKKTIEYKATNNKTGTFKRYGVRSNADIRARLGSSKKWSNRYNASGVTK